MLIKIPLQPTKYTKPLAYDTGDNEIVYWTDKDGVESYDAVGEFEPQYFGDAVVYVVGRRGSGKSTYCSAYLNSYYLQTMNKVFYVSRFQTDPSVELPERGLNIGIDDLPELTIEDLSNSLIVFDDIHSASLSKKEADYLHKFIIDTIENSRHFGISCLVTSHLATNYSKTRPILNEASSVVVYPEFSNAYQIIRMLSTYFDFSKPQIDHLFELGKKSRWVQVQTTNPKFILTSERIEIYK